jgi:lipoyl(octanoyl) transferase
MVHAVSLTGLTPYSEAYKLQLKLVELRIQDKIDDTILLLEHTPVITRGRGLQNVSSSSSEEQVKQIPISGSLPKDIEFVEVERGGDLTYHGPGQLVAYPIFKIKDVHQYLRNLEKILIDTLKTYKLKGGVKENATGVWIGDKKIASIGVAVRKWVTFHGMALNCVNDLKPFGLISPCGFSPEVMCRMSDRVKLSDSWREDLETNLATRFGAEAIIDVSCPDLLKDPSVLFSSADFRETHPTSNS